MADPAGRPAYDAVVLAGGTSRRMGVPDKTRLLVGGRPLLDRVLAAAAGARLVVAVGDERPTAAWCPGCAGAARAPGPVWTRERPAGGGPAAAVAAGLALAEAPVVALLAGDLPLLTRSFVERLVDSLGTRAGAVAVDTTGKPQWLCSAWRRDALEAARLAPEGSLHAALSPLDPVRVPVDVASPDAEGWVDCDTPTDLMRAEQRLADRV